MLNPLIKNRFETLNPDYAAFVKSDYANQAAESFGSEAGFDEQQISILSNGIILYLLLILTFNEFVDFISSECGQTKEQAFDLATGVLATLPDNFSETHQAAIDTLASASTQEKTKPTTPVHTMAQDMKDTKVNNEPVYTSTQAAILNETKTSKGE